MHKAPKDPARSAAALAFFKWTLAEGDEDADALHYVAMPPNVGKLIETYWKSEFKPATAAATN